MSLSIVLTIFRKEMLDMLRDKRTLIAMLGLPIVIYPALFIIGSQAIMVQQSRVKSTFSAVAIVGEDTETVRRWIENMPMAAVRPSDDPEADLAEGSIDAIVIVKGPPDQILRRNGTLSIEVQYDESEGASREAAMRVVEGLNAKYDELLDTRLSAAGIERAFVDPLDIQRKNIAPATKTTGIIVGSLMPFIMIVMIGIGAFYPAIDLTAGEKERGTFEALLSTPTSTLEIVYGKFLAVFALALLTGLLNLGSMVLTVYVQIEQMKSQIDFLELSIPPHSIAAFIAVMIPLAFFISAVMMSLAVLARGFREGQNLLTPFLLGLLFPAGLAAIPDARLTTGMQFVPIANVALLFKELMTDRATLQDVFAVLVSTIAYALLALLLAARIFQREEVILSEERGLPLTFKRSTFQRREVPTPGMVMFIYAVCLLLFFYVGTPLQVRFGIHGTWMNLWLGFLLPTIVILVFTRVNLRTALNLRMPNPIALPGTLLICAGWLVIVLQLGAWHERMLKMPPEIVEEINRILQTDTTPLWLLLWTIAITPAICEELLFRGAILNGLRNRMPAWVLLILVALLFGAAHVSVHKFLVTSASGLVLTYLVWRTRSVYLGILAHALINAGLIFVQVGQENTGPYPQALNDFIRDTLIENNALPPALLAAAVLTTIAGIVLIERTPRDNAP